LVVYIALVYVVTDPLDIL